MKRTLIGAAFFLLSAICAFAQSITPGVPLIPMGYCQLSAAQLAASIGLSSCVRASFTASAASNSTQLVVTSVTGTIKPGDQIITGTGLTAGTIITSQITGTPGGAGTYQLSAANTASSASVTSGGIPVDNAGRLPNYVILLADTAAVRWRDDGAAPTASIGNSIPAAAPLTYAGPPSAPRFIQQTSSAVLNISFYRTPTQ